MATGMYIGVSGVARKVKAIYIGVGGVARKVKNAYIGVSNMARLFFSASGFKLHSTLTSTTLNVSSGTSATIGNYAIFAGGSDANYNPAANVEAYDISLVKTTANNLSTASVDLSATTVGSYAIFAGGWDASWYSHRDVTAYSNTLARSTPSDLQQYVATLAGASIGNYAIFAGGYNGDNNPQSYTTCYNNYLSKTNATGLSVARGGLAGTSIGNYAIFAGGSSAGDGTAGKQMTNVDTYNASLTRGTATALSVARDFIYHTSTSVYAFFVCGRTESTTTTNNVDVYNLSLTKTTISSYALPWSGCIDGVVINDLATFITPLLIVFYDNNLTMTKQTVTGGSLAGRVGSYVLCADSNKTVRAYVYE